jgi:hypothetical protein
VSHRGAGFSSAHQENTAVGIQIVDAPGDLELVCPALQVRSYGLGGIGCLQGGFQNALHAASPGSGTQSVGG